MADQRHCTNSKYLPANAPKTESENTQQVKRNVALASHGAKANASSYALANQTRHFENLIDGSVDPRQAFPWVAANPGEAWIEIELAQPTQVDHVAWRAGSSMPTEYRLLVRETPAAKWDVVAHSNRRILHVSDRRNASDVRMERVPTEEIERLVKLLAAIRTTSAEVTKLSAGPQTYAASFDATVPATFLLRRGDPMQRERIVAPAVPACLRSTDTPQTFEHEAERRVMLAKHLTNPQHPLTARVIVNRVWQHHFGTGVVETPSDFGHMGADPSHPELLDWLAKEFIEHDWSLKWLHREIVSSKTYRQSSRPNAAAQSVDAASRLLWRYPPRRLEAEAIRDSILVASGKLNLTMYGRGFDFFNQRGGLSDYHAKETFDESGWRRMIYAHKIRMQSVDVFGAFDCPDAGQMTPKRNQSLTPLQALGLFNSPFLIRQATFFAERLRRERPGNIASQIKHAFRIVVARLPNETEQETMTALAETHGLEQACRVLLNSSEFVFQR